MSNQSEFKTFNTQDDLVEYLNNIFNPDNQQQLFYFEYLKSEMLVVPYLTIRKANENPLAFVGIPCPIIEGSEKFQNVMDDIHFTIIGKYILKDMNHEELSEVWYDLAEVWYDSVGEAFAYKQPEEHGYDQQYWAEQTSMFLTEYMHAKNIIQNKEKMGNILDTYFDEYTPSFDLRLNDKLEIVDAKVYINGHVRVDGSDIRITEPICITQNDDKTITLQQLEDAVRDAVEYKLKPNEAELNKKIHNIQQQKVIEKGFKEAMMLADSMSVAELQQKINQGVSKNEHLLIEDAIAIHSLRDILDKETGIKDTFFKAVDAIHNNIKAMTLNGKQDEKADVHALIFANNESDEYDNQFGETHFATITTSFENKHNKWSINLGSYIDVHSLPDDLVKPFLENDDFDNRMFIGINEINNLEEIYLDKLSIHDENNNLVELNQEALEHLNSRMTGNYRFGNPNTIRLCIEYVQSTIAYTLQRHLQPSHLLEASFDEDGMDLKDCYKTEYPEQVKRIYQENNQPKP